MKIKEEISEEEENKMIAMVLKKGIETIMGNHLFKWGDTHIYREMEGP